MTKSKRIYISKSFNTLILFSFIFFFGCTESFVTQPDLDTSSEEEHEWTDLDSFGDRVSGTEDDPQDPCPPDQLCGGTPDGGGNGEPGVDMGGGNGEDPEDPCPDIQLCDGDQTNEDLP